MKKLLLILLLGLSAYCSQGQVLRINKYLVDSLTGSGYWYLFKDTTHTGQWGLVNGGSGGGGGSGSGTVNNGTQYRIAYYATTGTAVSQAAAITASRALVSDVNGVPTHSAVTATELGYVSGVTSAIQTQLNSKQASGSYLVTTNNLSDVSNAATARTNLGATTVGSNLFTLTNPAAVTFIRLNADNTASTRTAAELKTDLSLNNVDNTSDATKNAATAALTNKDLTSGTNTFPVFNQSTTGSAATLTTPRAIYGNNFDGSAALTQIIASTYGGTGNGFTKFSGPTTAEKTFTLPDASATILTSNAAVTVAQGGTGLTSIAGLSIWVANSANTITTVTPAAGQSVRVNAGGTDWEAYTPGSGGGDVNKVGTPVNNQIGVWTGDGTLEGTSELTWDNTTLAIGGVASTERFLEVTANGPRYLLGEAPVGRFSLQSFGAGFDIDGYNYLNLIASNGGYVRFGGAASSAEWARFNNSGELQIGSATDVIDAVLQVTGNTYTSGNIIMGGTSVATSATKTFHLYNGTVPSASITDGVLLYSEDVAASAELKVRDEAGNITVLGPHTFTGIPGGRSEEMAWAFYSERDGKYINVDMLKLARVIEKLTGEKLVYIGSTKDELPNKENK